MKTPQQEDNKSNDGYPAGRSNEGGNFNSPNTGSSIKEGERRSENDPQNTSMGHDSQPASVNLNRGEGDQGNVKCSTAEQDETGRGDDENDSRGYVASNNAAGD